MASIFSTLSCVRSFESLARPSRWAIQIDCFFSLMGKNAIVLALGSEVENPEAYQLKVTDQGVTITAPTEAGVFYGIQTLRKSLPIAQGADVALPAVEIKDAPRFGYRGAHFDVSRHFFTIDEVKTYIDMLTLHNMNRLHWHITDDQGWRLEIKKYPKLTEIGSQKPIQFPAYESLLP